MLSYEQWDMIADAYVPLLGVLCIVVLVRRLWIQRLESCRRGLYLIVLVGIVYGVMFADKWGSLWGKLSLDYSTHTALAMALVVFLFPRHRLVRISLVSSFFAYLGLMLYQEYHSMADIVSTIAVISIPMFLVNFYLLKASGNNKQSRENTPPSAQV